MFNGQVSVFDATLQVKDQVPDSPEIQLIVSFLQQTQKGIIGKI